MENYALYIIELSVVGIVLFISIISFLMAMWAVIEVRSYKKSTHSVQLVPAEQANSPINSTDDFARQIKNEYDKKIKEDFDNIL